MLERLFSFFHGTFENKNELKKFCFLSLILGIIIGIYWVLRVLKDNVFFKVVGAGCQPSAKLLSLLITIPVVLIYSKLVDKYSRLKIFYILGIFFGGMSIVFALLMLHPTFGLENTVVSPYRIWGWLWYAFVEGFGSTMVVLFWSFTSDITSSESGKIGYPIITMGAQIGGLVFTLFFRNVTKFYGAPWVAFIIAGLIVLIPVLVHYFIRIMPKEQMGGFAGVRQKQSKRTCFWDGLKLMLSNPYLLGIFAVVSSYQIVMTIVDFQFKCLADTFLVCHKAFGTYLFDAAIYINAISILFLLLGVNSISRKLGLTASLILLPSLVAASLFVLKAHMTLPIAFWVIVFCKAINYALNQPTKEQLYIPTTKEAKYKSKAWIDMFGSRCSKSVGSAVNLLHPVLGPALFVIVSTGISLGIILVWILVGIFLGASHSLAIKNKRAVC